MEHKPFHLFGLMNTKPSNIDIMGLWKHVSPLIGLSDGEIAEGQWTKEDGEACLRFILVDQRS